MIVNLIQRRDLEGFLFFKIYMYFFLYQTIYGLSLSFLIT